MRYAWIAIVVLAGCSADPLEGAQDDLAAPSDFAVADLAVSGPDLADWCPASGPPPTCLGKPCAVGCMCEITFYIILPDLGGSDLGYSATSQDFGRCTCPGSGPSSLHGHHECCGGLDCYDGLPLVPEARCMPGNDCRR